MKMDIENQKPINKLELFEGNEWILPTDINLVESAKKALLKKLKQAGWKSEEVEDFVDGAFSEAITNSITHGNLGIPSNTPNIAQVAAEKQKTDLTDKKVYVSIAIMEDIIEIIVRDEGKGFDFENIPDPTAPENLLKPTGRGIMFNMKLSADDVKYTDGGRMVSITKKRK